MKERRDAIRQFIEARGEVSISQLAAEFAGWSEMTIRRDLAFLAKSRLIILTRGGARLLPGRYGVSEDIYSEREQRNFAAKQTIAVKAAALIEPGKSIYIDSGTTAMALARALPDYNLVVVTSGPNIALEIAHRKEQPSIVLLGGTLTRKSLAISDPEISRQLDNLNIDTAFLGASGYDEAAGFSVGSQLDGLLKHAVLERARRAVIMLDSSKIGVILPFTFARLDNVDTLITDDDIPEDLKHKLSSQTNVI